MRRVPAGLPLATLLARHLSDVTANSSAVAVVKDSDVKMHHVMSVKQSLREDLADQAYQFSCKAADWSSVSFSQVPMQFEPLELLVVEALGQQHVPEYFQQPAKAITEDVCHEGPSGPRVDSSSPGRNCIVQKIRCL